MHTKFLGKIAMGVIRHGPNVISFCNRTHFYKLSGWAPAFIYFWTFSPSEDSLAERPRSSAADAE